MVVSGEQVLILVLIGAFWGFVLGLEKRMRGRGGGEGQEG